MQTTHNRRIRPTAAAPEAETAAAGTKAVIYLRVSSNSQLGGDVDRDGFSIPAQRDACRKKAETLGAEVIEEFAERGESAKSMSRRSALTDMLARLTRGDVDFVIVHKLDRLARNRADDVEIVAKIRATGAQLVSVTENIDETPAGLLLHGIMSSIAEFYSNNLATEVAKGCVQKAKIGGTPHKAPIGYLNKRIWILDDGTQVESGNELAREIRTVAIDPERAPHIRAAFKLYATGKFALSDLAAILAEQGFRTRASRKAASRPIDISRLQAILNNDYYLGIVRYRGQVYAGRHEALVDEETFERVQTMLAVHRRSGTNAWRHHHYLSGALFCADCGRRLIYARHTGNGGLYEYFVCAGRQMKICDQPYHRIEAVEAAVADHYATVTLSREQRDAIARDLTEQLETYSGRASVERTRAERVLADLKQQERKLLDAHYADRISDELFGEEQDRVRRERVAATMTLERLSLRADELREAIEASLGLVTDAELSYRLGDDQHRRLLNSAIFERIEISREDVEGSTKKPPFSEYAAIAAANEGETARSTTKTAGTRRRRASAKDSNPAARRTPRNAEGAPCGAPSNSSWGTAPLAVDGSSFVNMVGETGSIAPCAEGNRRTGRTLCVLSRPEVPRSAPGAGRPSRRAGRAQRRCVPPRTACPGGRTPAPRACRRRCDRVGGLRPPRRRRPRAASWRRSGGARRTPCRHVPRRWCGSSSSGTRMRGCATWFRATSGTAGRDARRGTGTRWWAPSRRSPPRLRVEGRRRGGGRSSSAPRRRCRSRRRHAHAGARLARPAGQVPTTPPGVLPSTLPS